MFVNAFKLYLLSLTVSLFVVSLYGVKLASFKACDVIVQTRFREKLLQNPKE